MHPIADHVMAGLLTPSPKSNLYLLILSAILFSETGLLVGFFLPGDTILFATGVSVATGAIKTPFGWFLIAAPLAAIAGNLLGYWIGYRTGPMVFDRPNSRMFRPEYVTRSQEFFERYGARTIIIARFVPIVRTVASVMAGVGRMDFKKYVVYSIIGGVLWTCGILVLGERLGHIRFVQQNKQYVDYLVLFMVALSLVPALIHFIQGRRRPVSE
jgi:membrane-associated protein